MKVFGLLIYETEPVVLFSRARHDYRTYEVCKGVRVRYGVDGGQPWSGTRGWYNRLLLPQNGNAVRCWMDIPNVTSSDLHNDWNNRVDEHGLYVGADKISKIKIVDPPDTESFEWKKQNAIWGTYGQDGKQNFKYINLINAERNHLLAILKTETISKEYRDIINAILEQKN